MLTAKTARKKLNKVTAINKGTKAVIKRINQRIKEDKHYLAINEPVSAGVKAKLVELGYHVNSYKADMYPKGIQTTIAF
jgi:hypothetical protein